MIPINQPSFFVDPGVFPYNFTHWKVLRSPRAARACATPSKYRGPFPKPRRFGMPNDGWGGLKMTIFFLGARRLAQLIKLNWDDLEKRKLLSYIYIYILILQEYNLFKRKKSMYREKSWSAKFQENHPRLREVTCKIFERKWSSIGKPMEFRAFHQQKIQGPAIVGPPATHTTPMPLP